MEVDYMTQVMKKTDIISIRMNSNLSNRLHKKSEEQKLRCRMDYNSCS